MPSLFAGRAFVTAGTLPLPEVEAEHRRHALGEQIVVERNSAGLDHLPFGEITANFGCLALTVTAHILRRAVGQLAGGDLERELTVPGPARAQRLTTEPAPLGTLA